ncbi:MAG: ABC transporter ATP-binding protein [Xanthobacteraceae bacterium]
MSAPVVEVKGIVKELGEGATAVRALKGVDLSVMPGELTLLMGPSGSGKTTLLSILGCVLSPTEGSVTIAGRSTTDLKPEALAAVRRDHVGFVFQSFHLFPTLSAQENVQLVLDVRGEHSAGAVKRAHDALDAVGVAHRADAKPGQLSGGEQQRVAIARALVGNPSIILADEPTAALDGSNGHMVMSVLSKLAKERGRTILAVTHDPRTVPFADRIVHIEDGKIIGEERRHNG